MLRSWESESEILERLESEILESQSQQFWKGQIFYLRLCNPAWKPYLLLCDNSKTKMNETHLL